MKTEILIVSYAKDLPYLRYCVVSIAKFATGFSGLTLLVPEQERDIFFPELLIKAGVTFKTYPRVEDPAKWHLNAQMQKCHADEWCPQADFIAHLDSDCVFTEPVTPADYFHEGKPVMCIESFARLPSCPWQPVIAKTLRFNPSHETMRRHPQVNPRGIYEAVRDYVAINNGMAFDDYVLSQKPDFPWGFTEHNTIGCYARASRTWQDKYHWIDLAVEPWPHHKLMQFWSLSPPELEQDLPSGGRGLPLNEFKRLGLA